MSTKDGWVDLFGDVRIDSAMRLVFSHELRGILNSKKVGFKYNSEKNIIGLVANGTDEGTELIGSYSVQKNTSNTIRICIPQKLIRVFGLSKEKHAGKSYQVTIENSDSGKKNIICVHLDQVIDIWCPDTPTPSS